MQHENFMDQLEADYQRMQQQLDNQQVQLDELQTAATNYRKVTVNTATSADEKKLDRLAAEWETYHHGDAWHTNPKRVNQIEREIDHLRAQINAQTQ